MDSFRPKLPYQMLRKKPLEELDEDGGGDQAAAAAGGRGRGWLRLRGSSGGRGRWRRRRVRIRGLSRLLRRKAGLVGSCLSRVLRRFKEGRSQLGELFAGNYVFMQVSPALGCLQEKSFVAGYGGALSASGYYLPQRFP